MRVGVREYRNSPVKITELPLGPSCPLPELVTTFKVLAALCARLLNNSDEERSPGIQFRMVIEHE